MKSDIPFRELSDLIDEMEREQRPYWRRWGASPGRPSGKVVTVTEAIVEWKRRSFVAGFRWGIALAVWMVFLGAVVFFLFLETR